MMKQNEIVELAIEGLKEKLAQQKEVLAKTKLNHVISPLEDPISIKKIRKVIARLQTELRKRELAEQAN